MHRIWIFLQGILGDLRMRNNRRRGRCGCGGQLVPGTGCVRYYNSYDFDRDVMSESMMWRWGLGFGSAVLEGPGEAVMSMHLQKGGLTTEEADAIMFARSLPVAA